MTENLLTDDQDQVSIDPSKDYFKELVGEGKKFKSPEELARGKYESDQYIELLKKRQDELRADYLKIREENTSRASLEEIVEQFKKQQLASNDHTPVKEDENKPVYDPKAVESLVSNKIVEYETTKKQTDNFNKVKERLIEHYGKNYSSVLKEQIEELGLTDEDVNALARRSPAALFRTLGLDQQQKDSFSSPPRSNQRSDNFSPTSKQKRTWAYYQELKKTTPNMYYDPKIAVQMQQDAIDLGEEFRDGDYYRAGVHERN